jgi:hypothetical protein
MLARFGTPFRQFNPLLLAARSVVAAGMIRPRDLERSPNLKRIACLHKNVS